MANKKNPDIIDGIKHKIDTAGLPLEIVPIADLHIGDPHCNMSLIAGLIEEIAAQPNRYAVLVGDLMNTAITGSKSDAYGERLTPHQQLDKAVELLAPINNKILAAVPGNHEERISRSVGLDTPRLLVQQLGIEEVYRPDFALVFVRFGKNRRSGDPMVYSLYLNHGHGGGRRMGGKLNSLQDYALVIDVDCYIVGHTHLPAAYKSRTMRTVSQRGQAVLREQLFINTASAMSYGGYGARGGYTPASNAYPVISFAPDHHGMTVTL